MVNKLHIRYFLLSSFLALHVVNTIAKSVSRSVGLNGTTVVSEKIEKFADAGALLSATHTNGVFNCVVQPAPISFPGFSTEVLTDYDVQTVRSALQQAAGPNEVRSRVKLSSVNLLTRLGAGVAVVQVLIQRGGILGCTLYQSLQ